MLVDAANAFVVPFLLTDPATRAPVDADAPPPFRVLHGDAGQVGSGTAALMESGAVTGATAGSPPTVTAAAHGLATGCQVSLSGIGGMSGMTGTFTVTVTGANTFTLNGATGTGVYTAGGAWHTTGLYGLTFDGTLLSALEPGETYTVVVYPLLAAVTTAAAFDLTVV